jgi:hypothetical protein
MEFVCLFCCFFCTRIEFGTSEYDADITTFVKLTVYDSNSENVLLPKNDVRGR